MRTLLRFLLPLALGCSLQQKLDPSVLYKKDMKVTVNGYQGEGVLVVPKAVNFKIGIEARGNLDLLSYSTCHREVAQEEAWEEGWFESKREANLEYKPSQVEAESLGQCPLQFEGYEKKKGRHSWALIHFEDPLYKLPAHVQCNGNVQNYTGISLCQSKAGLLQRVTFAEDVYAVGEDKCPAVPSKGRVFDINIGSGECVYTFQDEQKRSHKFTSYGYEQIPLRED